MRRDFYHEHPNEALTATKQRIDQMRIDACFEANRGRKEQKEKAPHMRHCVTDTSNVVQQQQRETKRALSPSSATAAEWRRQWRRLLPLQGSAGAIADGCAFHPPSRSTKIAISKIATSKISKIAISEISKIAISKISKVAISKIAISKISKIAIWVYNRLAFSAQTNNRKVNLECSVNEICAEFNEMQLGLWDGKQSSVHKSFSAAVTAGWAALTK